jgi:hypothetical protein
MTSKFYYALLVIFLFVANSCSHKFYTNANFDKLSATHKTIAVLPATVTLTGTKPQKLTEADILKQEKAESLSFQQSLYNNILRHANSKKYETSIQLQPLEKTGELLKQQNILFSDVSNISDETLCKLLNVDAVVRLKVQKTRYLSDLASFGANVLNDILNTNVGVFIPGTTTPTPDAPTKTNDVTATCSVQSNGVVLWNDNYSQAADWKRPANDIIEDITNSFGLHFPYRKKKG